jgi:hypothetical protein
MEGTHYIQENVNVEETHMEQWRNHISSLDKEQFIRYLGYLESEWCINATNDSHISFQLGYKKFFNPDDLDPSTGMPMRVDIETITLKQKRELELLSALFHRARALEISDKELEDERKISERINSIIEQVDDAFHIVFRNTRIYERINNPTYQPSNPETDHSLFRCTTMGKVEELSPYQQAIISVLDKTYKLTIRRYKGQCCQQLKTPEGHNTRAWNTIMSIQDYVYSVAQKEINFDLWKNLTSRGSGFKDVIHHLSNCNDMQFPEITKNRHVWSFKNGIFIGKRFAPDTGLFDSKFYTYESPEFKCLDPTIVSCKYFDKHFEDYSEGKDWREIPTPYMDSILTYQKFDQDVIDWVYVMGGRLCFDVNDMDGWQIIPFFKGIARSGKSTLITKVFKKFYENDDVKTLSNNIEKKFGLSSIYNSFMFIAPEVKGDLSLEQAEFQSIVSGEDVSIAVKHQNAISAQWNTPGCLGGNEVPNWRDNSGSVLRRLLPWNFAKQVKDADPTLEDKLDQEIPIILQKCIRAYLEMSQKYKNKDIWNIVPSYFKNIQKQVAMVASTLTNFLESTNVKYGEDLKCPQEIFVKVFNQHCQANNLGKPRFNSDFYAGPFSSRDIEVKDNEDMYNGKLYSNRPFIFGLDVVSEELYNSD